MQLLLKLKEKLKKQESSIVNNLKRQQRKLKFLDNNKNKGEKMPAGKGTYGTKKGRPPKKKKNGKSKLDANKDGKISKEDFAILRNKKKKG